MTTEIAAATDLETQVADIHRMVSEIHTDIAQTRELIERVMTEVMPTIESLANSPMGKMFLKGLGS